MTLDVALPSSWLVTRNPSNAASRCALSRFLPHAREHVRANDMGASNRVPLASGRR